MAATINKLPGGPDSIGRRKIHFTDITLDSSYVAGGYSIDVAKFGAQAIEGIAIIGGNAAANAYKFHWDAVNKKLMVAWTGAAVSSAFAEVTAATNLSTIIVRVAVFTVGG